jgi:hypothetical protein
MAGYPVTNPINSHFGINPDGSVMQYMDCAIYGFHAESANAFSIGIDLIVPFSLSKNKATHLLSTDPAYPWIIRNGPAPTDGSPHPGLWTLISTTGRGVFINDFFSASFQQIMSLARLLKALSTAIGLPLTEDRNTDGPRSLRRFTTTAGLSKLVEGGVYHHCQFNSNRVDSFGTPLNEVVAIARSL